MRNSGRGHPGKDGVKWLLAWGVVVALGGCTVGQDPLGSRLAEGEVQSLSVSPDGDAFAWINGCRQPLGIGDACEAFVSDGDRVELLGSFPKVNGGILWGPSGTAGAIVGYSEVSHEGELRLWRASQGVESVATGVTAFALMRGRVVYVSKGKVYLSEEGGLPKRVLTIASAVSVVAVPGAAQGVVALVLDERRRLFAVEEEGGSRLVASNVQQCVVSNSGRYVVLLTAGAPSLLLALPLSGGRAKALGRQVVSMALSKNSDAVAFVDAVHGRERLLRGDLGSGQIRILVDNPVEYAWAAKAPVIAWIAGEARELGVESESGEATHRNGNTVSFSLSEDGSRVAYVVRGDLQYGNRLLVASTRRDANDVEVDSNVAGYALAGDGAQLFFRSWCTSASGGSCTLWASRAPFSNDKGHFRKFDGLVDGFKLDHRSADRVAWVSRGELKASLGGRTFLVDRGAQLEELAFLSGDRNAVVYVVRMPDRAGVYVARARRSTPPEGNP